MELEEVFSSKPRMKILKIIAQLGSLNISDIARRVKLNYEATHEHLMLLEAEGILQHRMYGRIRMYKFNEATPKARVVRSLIETWERENEKEHAKKS